MKQKETYTYLYLPKGEWLDALLTAFKVAGLELCAPDRCYEYTFVSQSLPILFQAVRSKEVWTDICDFDTKAKGGFTGSDIAREQGIFESRWKFPLYELEPSDAKFPRPEIYLGSTPNLRQQITKPCVADLEGQTIYTSYPIIARQFLNKYKLWDFNDQSRVNIKTRQGTIEGRWRTDKTNGAIIDITSTGKTMRANGIEVMEKIMPAEVVYIQKLGMNPRDEERVNDLREKLYLAAQKGGVYNGV